MEVGANLLPVSEPLIKAGQTSAFLAHKIIGKCSQFTFCFKEGVGGGGLVETAHFPFGVSAK